MVTTLIFVLVLALAASVAARPSNKSSGEFGDINDQNRYKLLDDMRLVDAQLEQTKAGGIPYSQFLWTGRQVPFVIDRSVSHMVNDITRAMMEYHQRTCIRFVPRTNQRNYIMVFAGEGCYSNVGMINQGQQPVSLGSGCEPYGTILHELGHAIGFYHEQNRDDRDDHVIIYWNNIAQGMEEQFAKLQPYQVDHLGTPYDSRSIMHYGSSAFSKDGRSYTMVKRNGEPLKDVHDKFALSELDIIAVNKMYGC